VCQSFVFNYTLLSCVGCSVVGRPAIVGCFVCQPVADLTNPHHACFTNARPPSHYWHILLHFSFSFRNSLLFVFVLDFFSIVFYFVVLVLVFVDENDTDTRNTDSRTNIDACRHTSRQIQSQIVNELLLARRTNCVDRSIAVEDSVTQSRCHSVHER